MTKRARPDAAIDAASGFVPSPSPAEAEAEAPDCGDEPLTEALADDARASHRSWRRIALIWGTAWHFALLIGVLLVLSGHKPWLLLPLAGLSASWIFLEYPWLVDRARAFNVVFYHLAISSVLSFAVVWADPDLTFLASVVLSQFSPLTGYRLRGVAVLTGGAVVLTLPIALRSGFDGGSLVGWALTAGSALLFNLFIGGFFVEMLNDHDRRGTLIRELEATRAELERVNHEAGVREERERLAREIHDTLAQGFTSLLMLVQAAEATLDTDPATTRQRLELAARTARENLAEARALIGGDPTAGLPLDAALQRAAARIGEELGIATSVAIDGRPQPLSANVQVVTLRVAQEALANVRKHAQAGSAAVRLAYGSDGLAVSVEDDGVGMEVAAVTGFGLRSMRERVGQVGGTVTITSAPGAGTRVEAEVPYE
ncbi:sensor histidine kinase [Catenulispora yoronensis]|uniref:Oxygen sensor histidine kinase NreB n=1 Tax=Catenulispora yoronensis TaxID=450799 RepID=A0ABN2TSF4_9ACTN